MSNQETLFVVVDPTQTDHVALERAIITSRIRDVPPKLKVFVGVDSTGVSLDADNPDIYRTTQWFESLRKPLDEEGLDYTLVICWSNQWHEAILQAAKKTEADLILVPSYATEELRYRFTDAKWNLIRHAPCPVLIVRPGAKSQRKVILSAVKMQSTNSKYEELNNQIIERGKWAAEAYGADFHVVNAYSDSMHYPDRGNMVRKIGIDSDKIHVVQGPPEEVVAKVAAEIEADIVVIGTLKRTGLSLAMRGNTSEQVTSKLINHDIMTLN
ncbi:universal stress protein [Pseudomaricurvus alkylphenolicus]|jgi:universal stress protein E|uniref:universal stress protein n=1 Tax=Pseudomaricurvus alkylphenolicus TaxID=1306991 RepID=UPI00142081FB|nr:universal stress protein [Pseudomaricurvus alkylphenolicus]NIB44027.1 universal stress protein [Pseudomaricurvus alkylphenolicus]